MGETLTADTSGIEDEDGTENTIFTYQWLADDADIDGATSSTYIVVDADQGKGIKVRASFTDDAGNDEGLTSEPTAAVEAEDAAEAKEEEQERQKQTSKESTGLPHAPVNQGTTEPPSSAVPPAWDVPDDGPVTGYRIRPLADRPGIPPIPVFSLSPVPVVN